ncbi:hypothetical protein AGIG_G1805 [Arapaima gigas]
MIAYRTCSRLHKELLLQMRFKSSAHLLGLLLFLEDVRPPDEWWRNPRRRVHAEVSFPRRGSLRAAEQGVHRARKGARKA